MEVLSAGQAQGSPRKLILFCAILYLLSVSGMFLAIWTSNGGHFTYALDDPYIHLALAENLAHGHYGINPVQFSSPSSSVLWPLLLVPLAGTRFHVFLPLLWNFIFGLTASCLIGYAVATWPPQVDNDGRMAWWKQAITSLLLMLVANLVSLTLTGMEHVLQVLLAICCAIGVMKALSGNRIPYWCLVAATLAPMVRYEDVAITLAICVTLIGQKEIRKAGCVLGLSLLPLIAFSAFLHSKGLPILPMSVMVKGSVYRRASIAVTAFRTLRRDVFDDLVDPLHLPLDVLFLIFVAMTLQSRSRARRFAFGGTALLGAAQLLVGRWGWFGRYEVYAVIFLTMICLYVLSEQRQFLFGYFVIGLIACATPYLTTTETTVHAARDVYRNQYQMHRFVTEFYRGNYAVNDLGLVSFQRRAGSFVLDVYGLASPDAARQQDKTADWLQGIVERHNVKLAMLFPEWFSIPTSWTPILKLCEPGPPVVLEERCTVFYSTSLDANAEIRTAAEQFAKTLPPDVHFYFNPERKWGGEAPEMPK